MTKVLMSAFIGSRNLGDEAIFHTLLREIQQDGREITVLAVNPEKASQMGVGAVYSNSVINVVREIRNCDIMLVGGGGIIQDQSSILNFLYYAFQLFVARINHKPVILNFVGVGPIRFGLSRMITRWLMPSVKYAIVRDQKSGRILSEVMGDERVHVAYDPVLNFLRDKSTVSDDAPLSQPYVLVSLRRWFFSNPFLPASFSRKLNKFSMFRRRYESFVGKLASDLDAYLDVHADKRLLFVPLYTSEDNQVNQDVSSLMKNSDRVLLVVDDIDENEFLSAAMSAEFIIGMRLHSLILGANLGKPFVALRYSSKVDEFTDQMGLLEHSVNIEEYDSKKLQSAFEYVDVHVSELEPKILETVFDYRQKNEKAFQILNQKITENS